MCPNECPGLDEVWGEEFEKLYERYEEGRGRAPRKGTPAPKVRARDSHSKGGSGTLGSLARSPGRMHFQLHSKKTSTTHDYFFLLFMF